MLCRVLPVFFSRLTCASLYTFVSTLIKDGQSVDIWLTNTPFATCSGRRNDIETLVVPAVGIRSSIAIILVPAHGDRIASASAAGIKSRARRIVDTDCYNVSFWWKCLAGHRCRSH